MTVPDGRIRRSDYSFSGKGFQFKRCAVICDPGLFTHMKIRQHGQGEQEENLPPRLIVKLDPVTGKIVKTDQRNKIQSPDYESELYEKDYVMPRTLAQRKKEFLRLLKENYEFMQQLEVLGNKISG